MTVYKPNEFAKMVGVSTRTLRRWDASGLLKAYRTPTNQKYYTREQYIDYCLNSGMSMEFVEAALSEIEAKPKSKTKTKTGVSNDNIGSEPSDGNTDDESTEK